MKRNIYNLLLCLFLTVGSHAQSVPDNNAGADKHEAADRKTVANEITIRGTVIDAATHAPVLGAAVKPAGAQHATLTNEQGAFTLKVGSTRELLLIEAVGYLEQEVALKGRLELKIKLLADKFTSNYGSEETLLGIRRKTSLANSTSQVSDFSFSPSATIETDIQNRLGGDVRSITRSGLAGIGNAMFIRGYNSLNANAQPLIVVDDVIWDNQLARSSIHGGYFTNPLTDIDVKDIQSVTVLKDGNSIYGSKAANGVILIKTNRGRSQATQITADIVRGVNMSPKELPVMDAGQYRTYVSDQLGNQGYNSSYIDLLPYMKNEPINKYANNTDWQKNIYRNSNTSSYSFRVNGGDDVALYSLSMGYMGADGVLKNTDMDRLNARFNSDIKLSTKLHLDFDLSFSRVGRNVRDDGANERTAPGYVALIKSPFLNEYQYTVQGTLSQMLEDHDVLGVSNPGAIVENAIGTTSQYRFNTSVRPTYKINDKLEISSLIGYSLDKVKENYFSPMFGVSPKLIENYGISYNTVKNKTMRQVSLFSDSRMKWKFDFARNNHLDATGGFRFQSNTYESDYAEGHNTGNDKIKELSNSLDFKKYDDVQDQWKSMSWYANADYNYLYKYFLTASASLDASSRFGSNTDSGFRMFNQTWALFPSLSGAWLVSSENFFRNIRFVDMLKFHLGYGLAGNDDIDNYASHGYFGSTNYIGKAVGLVIQNVGNEKIQWEISKKASAGLNANLFGNRLALSVDVYQSKTDHLLTLKPLSDITGLDYYWSNDGALENKGFEISANVKVLDTRSWKWEVGASVAHYKNKITALPNGQSYTTPILGGEILTQVGMPAGLFYGYKSKGVLTTAQQAEGAHNGSGYLNIVNENGSYSKFMAGDMLFDDKNGDGLITDKDKQVIGNPNPDLTGTFNTQIACGRFTLNALFTFSYGNDVYNYLRYKLESGDSYQNQTKAMLNRWTIEGQQTSMPRASVGDPMGNARFSDRWIEDGSYLKFKSLTLSYDIPINLSFIPGLTVWASVNNVATWTKYLGRDPEFSYSNSVLYQGVDAGLLPQSRSYCLGLKINL